MSGFLQFRAARRIGVAIKEQSAAIHLWKVLMRRKLIKESVSYLARSKHTTRLRPASRYAESFSSLYMA